MGQVRERWGVRYPKSGVHICLDEEKARQVCFLAILHNVWARVVVDRGNGWEEVGG